MEFLFFVFWYLFRGKVFPRVVHYIYTPSKGQGMYPTDSRKGLALMISKMTGIDLINSL